MKYLVLMLLATAVLLASCLSTNMKDIMPPPYVPPDVANADAAKPAIVDGANLKDSFKLGFVDAQNRPVIDGKFDEWQNVPHITTQIAVFGGSYDAQDGEVSMAMLTTGKMLYIHLRVTDDLVQDNQRSLADAWQGDSVDIFWSTKTWPHGQLTFDDKQLRIVPLKNDALKNFEFALFGKSQRNRVDGTLVYTKTGYELEMALPVGLISDDNLSVGQAIRLSLQLNDGDKSDRDRLLHWVNPNDSSWHNFADWGYGSVVKYEAGGK